MMRTTFPIATLLAASFLLSSCHPINDWDNTAQDNFDALWTLVDEHYCFFDQKNIDWDACYDKYAQRVYPGMSSQMLFQVCSDMLAELEDGHVNLASYYNTYYYTNWWSDFPQDYDDRLVNEFYLGFDCRRIGSVKYCILSENIGYIRYPSFSFSMGQGNIDALLSYFSSCIGIIIDIRDNGGGELTAAENLVCRLMGKRELVGYMVNKTGPGHNDFSAPYPVYYEPPQGHVTWSKPVAVLTNRSTFSAANHFVAVARSLPNVKIVGARTGGGSGIPLTFDLPIGWTVRMSAVSMLDASGNSTEGGIAPTEGCEVGLDKMQALSGTDTMIEKAIETINNW